VRIVASARPRLVVAFDASSVSGARFARALTRSRLSTFARIELPPGALTPSALGPNVQRPDAVGEALAALRRRLGSGSGATLVLPDGVGRVLLLDTPEGTDDRAYVRFRLAASLPYPAEEATFDVLSLGRGRALGAAVRRSVVAEYERAAVGAGFTQERVDLAPLIAVAGLLRRGAGVHVLLGDAALSLAAFQDARLTAFRTRRRDRGPGEARRLLEEAERTALLGGGDGAVTFVGAGARDLVQELVAAGSPVSLGPGAESAPDGAEAAWLAGVLS
jgi:hypothetical protein